jgi:hypothetical protein
LAAVIAKTLATIDSAELCYFETAIREAFDQDANEAPDP